ncbi:MAG: hypothetical protein GXP24_02835 [Planctomycetes bacterium]|nr:hypothetical protein [Planctomycetota bacterium]
MSRFVVEATEASGFDGHKGKKSEGREVQIRDRIKELRRVRAGDLQPHPKNWRTHPDSQRDALRGVLADIGYADALLVREGDDGLLELIDGHLRAETTPDALVPVLVLDVSADEADKILLTHDPLAAMAGADRQRVGDLVESCDFEHPQVVEMLDQLEKDLNQSAWPSDDEANRPEVDIPELYQVVIECEGEHEQEQVYQRMRKEGYRCRVLTL